MESIDSNIRLGHIHLKVSDLERSIKFYSEVLGLNLKQRLGNSAAFLSAGDYHHHLGLNTWESKGGFPPAHGSTGIFHFALLYPTRKSLSIALRRVLQSGVTLDGAADHGVSEAIYIHDPDHIGIELYYDRPESEWPRTASGDIAMTTLTLDLEELLSLSD